MEKEFNPDLSTLNGNEGVWKPAPKDQKFEAQPQDLSAYSDVITARTDLVVPPTGGDHCYSNNCTYYAPPNAGCAQCATPTVRIPINAILIEVRFSTTASYPDDWPEPHVVQPGDIAWSYYDGWGQDSSGSTRVIYAGYHNRSHNRPRRIRLEVDYRMP